MAQGEEVVCAILGSVWWRVSFHGQGGIPFHQDLRWVVEQFWRVKIGRKFVSGEPEGVGTSYRHLEPERLGPNFDGLSDTHNQFFPYKFFIPVLGFYSICL